MLQRRIKSSARKFERPTRTTEQAEDGASYLKQVDKLLKEGNFEGAHDSLARAREFDPMNPYLEAYEERLESLKSLQPLNAIGEQEPIDLPTSDEITGAHIQDVQRLCLEGKLDQALQEVGLGLTIDPCNEELLRLKGEIENTEVIKKESARIAVARAVSSRVETAESMVSKGQFEEALQELTQAFIMDPLNDLLLAFEDRHLSTILSHQDKKLSVPSVAA